MKKLPYIAAALIAIATLAIWATGGFHTGWTQTSIPVTGVDEFTGIEYTTYEDGFIAGVDALGGGIAVAVAIAAASFGAQRFITAKQN